MGSSPSCGMEIWRRTDAASAKCRRWSETACASRRWVKPAYAGAESKPSNSARARNTCEHAIALVVPPERLSKVGCHLSIAQNVPAAVMLLPASLQAQIAELQDSVRCRVPEVSRPIARSARSPSRRSIPASVAFSTSSTALGPSKSVVAGIQALRLTKGARLSARSLAAAAARNRNAQRRFRRSRHLATGKGTSVGGVFDPQDSRTNLTASAGEPLNATEPLWISPWRSATVGSGGWASRPSLPHAPAASSRHMRDRSSVSVSVGPALRASSTCFPWNVSRDLRSGWFPKQEKSAFRGRIARCWKLVADRR